MSLIKQDNDYKFVFKGFQVKILPYSFNFEFYFVVNMIKKQTNTPFWGPFLTKGPYKESKLSNHF